MESSPIRVAAAVIEQGRRLLVARRPLGKRHGGLWEFPGGKLEVGESDMDGVARELREEFGVHVTAASLPLAEIRDPDSPHVIAFLTVAIEGVPEPREHIAIQWATLSELHRISLAPADRLFVEERSFARARGRGS